MISVVIPLYNNEKYIGPCLESLISQTVPDWEAIVVDDGSTDMSLHVAKGYSDKDSRIKVLHQENKRVGAARNYGIRESKGDYLAFMDSDDLLEATAFEKAMSVMKANEADMVQWEAHFFHDNKADVYDYQKETGLAREHCEIVANAEEAFYLLLDERGQGSDTRFRMLRNSCRCVWTKLCKRQVFDGIWFPEDREYEDDFIVHRLFLNSAKTVFINDELTNKRDHATSVLHTMSLKGEFDHVECQKQRMLTSEEYGQNYSSLGAHAYFTSILNFYIACSSTGDKTSCSKIIDQCRDDYSVHQKYLSPSDRKIIKFFCLLPLIGGKIYSIYRKSKG